MLAATLAIMACLFDGTAKWALEMEFAENPKYSHTEFRRVSKPVSIS
jgi:hypothetical protein